MKVAATPLSMAVLIWSHPNPAIPGRRVFGQLGQHLNRGDALGRVDFHHVVLGEPVPAVGPDDAVQGHPQGRAPAHGNSMGLLRFADLLDGLEKLIEGRRRLQAEVAVNILAVYEDARFGGDGETVLVLPVGGDRLGRGEEVVEVIPLGVGVLGIAQELFDGGGPLLHRELRRVIIPAHENIISERAGSEPGGDLHQHLVVGHLGQRSP